MIANNKQKRRLEGLHTNIGRYWFQNKYHIKRMFYSEEWSVPSGLTVQILLTASYRLKYDWLTQVKKIILDRVGEPDPPADTDPSFLIGETATQYPGLSLPFLIAWI